MRMVEVVSGLILLLAGGVLSAVGYVHRVSNVENKERKREIDNLDERLSTLEANLYGHEEGSEGYFVSTEAEFRRINRKLDELQEQIESDHVEAKSLLGEVVQWIEGQNGEGLDIDYERSIEFTEEND